MFPLCFSILYYNGIEGKKEEKKQLEEAIAGQNVIVLLTVRIKYVPPVVIVIRSFKFNFNTAYESCISLIFVKNIPPKNS